MPKLLIAGCIATPDEVRLSGVDREICRQLTDAVSSVAPLGEAVSDLVKFTCDPDHLWPDLSLREFAGWMGMPDQTVSSRFYRPAVRLGLPTERWGASVLIDQLFLVRAVAMIVYGQVTGAEASRYFRCPAPPNFARWMQNTSGVSVGQWKTAPAGNVLLMLDVIKTEWRGAAQFLAEVKWGRASVRPAPTIALHRYPDRIATPRATMREALYRMRLTAGVSA